MSTSGVRHASPSEELDQRPTKKSKIDHPTTATDDTDTSAAVTMAAATTTTSMEVEEEQKQDQATITPSSSSSSSSSSILSPHPSPSWSYVNQRILAPMVRIGTLPMRRLAVKYGATIVYSEELIAKKLKDCKREVRIDEKGQKWIYFIQTTSSSSTTTTTSSSSAATNNENETDNTSNSNTAATVKKKSKSVKDEFPVLVTYPGEPLVVQLGAGNSEDALAAAKVVEKDVRAIDLNCGCPKHFSLQGGMGAALLSKPDTLIDILTTLRRNIDVPITCKIRLLANIEDTITLVKRIETSGVSAIALHARRIEDRPRHRALPELVRQVADSIRIPLIYNGDYFYAHEVDALKSLTGASSVMSARGAMWNASLFKSDGVMLPISTVVRDYLEIASSVENHFTNTKYCIMEMLKGPIGSTSLFRSITRSKNYEELSSALEGMENESILLKGDREYQVNLLLEDRPVRVEGAETTDNNGNTNDQSTSGGVVKELSKKEKKYQAKQNRKNREGRKADEEAKAAAAIATPAPATSSLPVASNVVPSGTVSSVSSSSVEASPAPKPEPADVWCMPSTSSPSTPIRCWLETDLEPDDVLSIWLLFRSRRVRITHIVVGEGTNISKKVQRMRGYLRLMSQEGLITDEDVKHITIIPGTPSKRPYTDEGCEFLDEDGVNLLETIPNEEDSYNNMDRQQILSNYRNEITTFLDAHTPSPSPPPPASSSSVDSGGMLVILLKPMHEFVSLGRIISSHRHWCAVTLAAYGGFNIRSVLEEACLTHGGGAASQIAAGERLKHLFQTTKRTLLLEAIYAFSGASTSMNPQTMPLLYEHLRHSSSSSPMIRTLARLIQSWNLKTFSECETLLTSLMEHVELTGQELSEKELQQFQRYQRISQAISTHPTTQLVCADHGLINLLLHTDEFRPWIHPIRFEFELTTATTKVTTMGARGSKVHMPFGLTLQEMDRIGNIKQEEETNETEVKAPTPPAAAVPEQL